MEKEEEEEEEKQQQQQQQQEKDEESLTKDLKRRAQLALASASCRSHCLHFCLGAPHTARGAYFL